MEKNRRNNRKNSMGLRQFLKQYFRKGLIHLLKGLSGVFHFFWSQICEFLKMVILLIALAGGSWVIHLLLPDNPLGYILGWISDFFLVSTWFIVAWRTFIKDINHFDRE